MSCNATYSGRKFEPARERDVRGLGVSAFAGKPT
jgi:hypothetical protein